MIIPIYGMRSPPGSRADQRQAWPIDKVLPFGMRNGQACDIIAGAIERGCASQPARLPLIYKGEGIESDSGFVQGSSGSVMLDCVGCLPGAVGIGK
jgi:hypothetical protein